MKAIAIIAASMIAASPAVAETVLFEGGPVTLSSGTTKVVLKPVAPKADERKLAVCQYTSDKSARCGDLALQIDTTGGGWSLAE